MRKKLGLPSIIATGVGLIVATSCLLSIGQGSAAIGTPFIITMVIACAFNILTALSICELNALMPNLTGGMAQYTLASFGPFVAIVITVGGYLTCQTIMGSSEAAMFGNTLSSVFSGIPISGSVYSIVLIVLLAVLNLFGVDMFAKIQNIVAYGLIGSLMLLGILGTFRLGTGTVVEQPAVLSSSPKDIFSLLGLAFFLFIGVEFIVPISTQVDNPRKKVPIGMVISLVAILVMQIFVTGFGKQDNTVFPAVFFGKRIDFYIPWGIGADKNLVAKLFSFLVQFVRDDRDRISYPFVFPDDVRTDAVFFPEDFIQLFPAPVSQVVLNIINRDVERTKVYNNLQVKILGD